MIPWIVMDFLRQLVIFTSCVLLIWYNAQLLTRADWMVAVLITNIVISLTITGWQFQSLVK